MTEQGAGGPSIEALSTLLREAAEAELLPRFARTERELKADGSIVTEADLAMQERVQSALAAQWPGIGFLGEEMPAAAQRAQLAAADAGLWCLDPLDGTSNFAAGLPFFSVSLALLVGGTAVLGLVYDPVRRECFSARRGAGAWLNGDPLGARVPRLPLARAIAAVDFKRLPARLASRLAAAPPYSSQRSLGSVALDWCWVAAGRFHVYVHGSQKLWDYAAGELVLAEAGGHSCTLEGEPVFAAEVAPRSAVAALDDTLFGAWRTALGIPPGPGAGR